MSNTTLMRLNVRTRKDGFVIHDTISGDTITFENGKFQSFTLDKDSVIKSLTGLRDLVINATKRWSIKNPTLSTSNDETLTITNIGRDIWSFSLEGRSAYLDVIYLKHKIGFNVNDIVTRLDQIIYHVVAADKILTPRSDIVRRVPDAHLVVWTYKEHSTVCYEECIKGCTMTNCLVDGKYYDLILVQPDTKTNTCILFTSDFDEIVTYPLDNSILFFYKEE